MKRIAKYRADMEKLRTAMDILKESREKEVSKRGDKPRDWKLESNINRLECLYIE